MRKVTLLAKQLKEANEAYRNGMPLLMTDEEYDRGIAELTDLKPDHPLLKQVRGAVVGSHAVTLPYYLGSLDKAKTSDELAKWISKHKDSYVLSEKLDGISSLLNPARGILYLSGEELSGLDVSAWLPHMDIKMKSVPESVWIRGELIMPTSRVPAGRLGRSIVNGIFHQKTPDPKEATKVQFIGYEIIGLNPLPTTVFQMLQIKKWGIRIPWTKHVDSVTAEELSALLTERRDRADYEMDGIVIKTNTPAERPTKGNPKDAIAWKPPTGEAKVTKVVRVEWNASAVGRLVPRVEVEPVQLGGSTITFVTGVNARRVQDWSIGPGASVILRKGGDVIPVIDSVEVPGKVTFPEEGTWVWETEEHINIRQVKEDASTVAAQFTRMAKVLEWDSVGPAQMKAVVEAGYTTVPALLKVSEKDLQKLLGPIKGAKFYSVLREGWSRSEVDLFLASPLYYAGIGRTKLDALLATQPDVTQWAKPGLAEPEGWSAASLETFQKVWKEYETFRRKEWSFVAYPQKTEVKASTSQIAWKGSVVLSGFRSAALEESLIKRGYQVVDSVRSDTKAVLIKDSEDPQTYTSGKVEKAKKIPGCMILRQADVSRLP
jgi:NAD-dependent DNA ligase